MGLFSERRARRVIEKGSRECDDSALETAINNRKQIIAKVINSASLAPFLSQVTTLFNLIQDYVKGDYREIPWWSIGSVATALLYILIPMDAIPDFIPLAGFVDDAAVLKICLDMISKDLALYRASRENLDQESD